MSDDERLVVLSREVSAKVGYGLPEGDEPLASEAVVVARQIGACYPTGMPSIRALTQARRLFRDDPERFRALVVEGMS